MRKEEITDDLAITSEEQMELSGKTQKKSSKPGLIKMFHSLEYRKKWLRTLFIGCTFGALGSIVAQRGPSFLDLQIITQSNVESASFFFTAGSVGYLVGSLLAGVIYDKINKSFLLIGLVLGLSLTTIALPWCSLYSLMITAFFFCSLFGGGLDTAGNAELVRTWSKDGDMAMQFLHFSFAFGGIISPLFTEPFLAQDAENVTEHSDLPLSSASPVSLTNSSESTLDWPNNTSNMTTKQHSPTTNIHYAYLITGIIAFCSSIPFVIEWFHENSKNRRQGRKDTEAVKQPLPLFMLVVVQCILCVYYFFYCCVEDTFASYLSTFVVKQLLWSKSQGAQITSVYWASFASCRFLSIFIAYFISPVKLLITCGLLIIISLLGFLLSSHYHIDVSVWVCAIGIGAAMSAVFPTGFTWMEQELIRVNGRVASFILIASSTGTMTNPIFLGYLMQEITPMWFIYLLLSEACLCFLVFLSLLALSRFHLQQKYMIREIMTKEIPVTTLQDDGDNHNINA